MLDTTPMDNTPSDDHAAEPAGVPAKKAGRKAAAAKASAVKSPAAKASAAKASAAKAPAAKAPAAKAAAAKAPAARAPRKTAAKKAAPAAAGTAESTAADRGTAESAATDPGTAALTVGAPATGAPADQPAAASAPDSGPDQPGDVAAKKTSRARKAPAEKAPAKKAPAKKAAGRAAAAQTAAGPADTAEQPAVEQAPAATGSAPPAASEAASTGSGAAGTTAQPAKRTARKRVSKAAAAAAEQPGTDSTAEIPAPEALPAAPALAAPAVLFQPPAETAAPRRRRGGKRAAAEPDVPAELPAEVPDFVDIDADLEPEDVDVDELGTGELSTDELSTDEPEAADGTRRRRRRGRRGRGSRSAEAGADTDTAPTDLDEDEDEPEDDHAEEVAEAALSASARRRRRRRRSSAGDGAEAALSEDDPPNTVVHVRDSRAASRGSAADDDGVRGVKGSTRLEAKRQRRRDNRDTGRRRAPILTEAEFLARRESVDRVMAVRQAGDRTQIAVLEDDILVEHYVTRASASSAVGNVYLGRVQNVLPSMEAAFVDIGRGRNGVLYAGEVNWDVAGLEGKSRSIENALNAGDMVLVQVTKDPIGHKGARLTSQISLPGRFVVYVPGGGMTGISRKLPDVERSRLKAILKKVVPDEAGVIVRTAAEGASEQDLISDVERLKSEWESISTKSAKAKQSSEGPSLLHGEPDLAIRVVRDIFNDDFKKLVVAGAEIHRTINDYVRDIAPDLADRISRHTGESDLFRDLRVDEQLAKALDRKVWLPSGGSLVIDRTEAMTVVDVNTGKYTGSGGNLEQTVTRNNLEAAEEIVRQLRLRDIGGIVVIDFIDMVLESNRDLVLRRLTECLGRDRTKHQVAEVTSLGLVQMTRKRVGEGLLEAFSEPCSVCNGRGVIVHLDGMDRRSNGASPSATSSSGPAAEEDRPARGRRSRKATKAEQPAVAQPDPAEIAAEAEKRRVAASAVAAIAAATGHHDDAGSRPAAGSHPANPAGEGSEPAPAEPSAWGTAQPGTAQSGPAEAGTAEAGRTETGPAQPSPVDPSPVEPSPAEPGRTGRGRAARGRSRADRDRTDQDGVAKNRPERGVGDSSTPAQPPPAATTEPAPAAATEPAPVATQPPPAAPEVGAGQSGAAQPVRPRRRRAASRPAGPPVPVNAVDG